MSDRGMKKWVGFKSLPEYEKELLKIMEEKKKVIKPSLCDDEMDLINNTLQTFSPDSLYIIKYFDNGNVFTIRTHIEKIDSYASLLVLPDKKKIKIIDILEINT